MKTSDIDKLTTLLAEWGDIHAREITPSLVQAYANKLQDLTIEQIAAAGKAHDSHPDRGRFFPKPADLRSYVIEEDGFPTADEAWAICPSDESQSVVWCDEIVQAWGIAEPIMSDRVAARMAFKGAYERLVAQARAEGRRPVWTASLGHDKHSRRDVIEAAARAGRLTHEHAAKLLPAPESVPDLPMLEMSAGKNAERRETLKRLKAMLGSAA